MIELNYSKRFLVISATVGMLGCHMNESSERPARTAFTEDTPLEYREKEPIGSSVALMLSRPSLTGIEIAELAHSMAEVVAEDSLPPVGSIPSERMESFEKAAAAVEGRVWLTIETGGETLEFNYYPEKPAIMVGLIEREQPQFTEPGVYPGVGRDAALRRARHCADLLVEDEVVSPQSYVREPVLERAPSKSFPAAPETAEKIEVTDYYHFIFGQAPNGILLGNSELTIDVDAHSGRCFRVEVAFIDFRQAEPVELIVSIDEARAAVEGDVPSAGGEKMVGDTQPETTPRHRVLTPGSIPTRLCGISPREIAREPG